MSGAGTCSSATFRHARHCRTERRPHIRGPIGTPASCSSVAPISASESTSTLAAQSASMAGNAPTDSNSSRRAATSASMDRERKKEGEEDVSRKKLKTKIRVFFLRTRARSKTRRASLHVGSCRAVWSVVTRCHIGARVLPVVIFSHQCARVLAREARPVFLGNRVQLLGSTSFRAACRVRRLGKGGV